MTVLHVAIVALVSMALNGALTAFCLVYRAELRKLRIRLRWSQSRAAMLRKELQASLSWNTELNDAKNTVDQILAEDPYQQERNAWVARMSQLWNSPAVVPPHERGAR